MRPPLKEGAKKKATLPSLLMEFGLNQVTWYGCVLGGKLTPGGGVGWPLGWSWPWSTFSFL